MGAQVGLPTSSRITGCWRVERLRVDCQQSLTIYGNESVSARHCSYEWAMAVAASGNYRIHVVAHQCSS